MSLWWSLPVPALVLGFGQIDPTYQKGQLFVTFKRLRWALQNKNRCPLRGSHDKRSRTRPYSPSNPLRMSVTPAAR